MKNILFTFLILTLASISYSLYSVQVKAFDLATDLPLGGALATVTLLDNSTVEGTTHNVWGGVWIHLLNANSYEDIKTITLEKTGYISSDGIITYIKADSMGITFKLAPENTPVGKGNITGKVVNSNNDPIENASVNLWLWVNGSSSDLQNAGQVNTNSSGEFSFLDKEAPQAYSIIVNANGFSSDSKDISLLDAEDEVLTFVLEEATGTGTITVNVTDENLTPISDVSVTLKRGSDIIYGNETTPINGQVVFGVLNLLGYDLEINYPNYKVISGDLQVLLSTGNPSQTVDIVLKEKDPGQISGTITNKATGGPAESVPVGLLVRSIDGNGKVVWNELNSENTNQIGEYTFSNVRPSSADYVYRIQAGLDTTGVVVVLEGQITEMNFEADFETVNLNANTLLSGFEYSVKGSELNIILPGNLPSLKINVHDIVGQIVYSSLLKANTSSLKVDLSGTLSSIVFISIAPQQHLNDVNTFKIPIH